MRVFALCLIFMMVFFPALAVEPGEVLQDAALEVRARDISRQVRCLVCQGEAIDDSNADLARDLRRLIRVRLTAGDTDAQVLDFLRTRYGDFVLLKPPVAAKTLLLWLTPALVLAAGLVMAGIFIRRRKS